VSAAVGAAAGAAAAAAGAVLEPVVERVDAADGAELVAHLQAFDRSASLAWDLVGLGESQREEVHRWVDGHAEARVRTWGHVSRTVSSNQHGERVLRLSKPPLAGGERLSAPPVEEWPLITVNPDQFRELMNQTH
jgi:hypothetical protein